jgi:hypothetical protein
MSEYSSENVEVKLDYEARERAILATEVFCRFCEEECQDEFSDHLRYIIEGGLMPGLPGADFRNHIISAENLRNPRNTTSQSWNRRKSCYAKH